MPEATYEVRDGVFTPPLVLQYPYKRTVGPVVGRFLTGLRQRRIWGVRANDGTVLVPPPDFDPRTGQAMADAAWVEVGQRGVILTWSWVPEPFAGQPLIRPFAWALIRLDGAGVGLLHAVDVGPDPGARDRIRTGAQVVARWREETQGSIADLVCFDLVEVIA